MDKLRSLKGIKKVAAALKRRHKKIVFTNGCFDILHYGHVRYLEKCKNMGDILIVGLNSDSSVRKIKGKTRPLTGEKERAAILAALEFVDYVVIFGESTPERLIKEITPDILAKGGDWKEEDIAGGEHVKAHGGRVVTIPFVTGYSTTLFIKRAKNA